MDTSNHLIKEKPVLFYASRCGKCRILSQLVVWSSFHTIERIPIESQAVEEFCQQHPEARGQLVLFHQSFRKGKFLIGNWVYLAVPWLILKTWLAISFFKVKTLADSVSLNSKG
ncbi:hypothetical protein BLD44_017615 [Mastigocladus laminosus UU774]|nr:hypothetical protein BLD44_017615 [Mastigocladus laminosus UU774]